MKQIWLHLQVAIYTLGIYGLGLGIRIGALWSDKLKKWIDGRRAQFSYLEEILKKLPETATTYWFHCASLGEFEQGRPVLEQLRIAKPQARILLSFFSPSGYEIQKNYSKADLVFYLPLDTPLNAKRIARLLQADYFIAVKYEFWYHLLKQLKRHSCKILLISAAFRRKQWFFHPWLSFGHQLLGCFDRIYVQDEQSLECLQQIGYNQAFIGGDTRVDRVLERARAPKTLTGLKAFIGTYTNVLVAGSTWPPDEKLLSEWLADPAFADWKVILAPHEISNNHLRKIEETIPEATHRYSDTSPLPPGTRIMLLDTMGDLSSAYQFASHAYIGGGFGKGIHNILEAAAYGVPVFFGPNFNKFREAHELIRMDAGFSVKNAVEFKDLLHSISPENRYLEVQKNSLDYLHQNQGASKRIIEYLSLNFE